MRNYLTFDNKDSLDFGVYINGQGTFRAPARSYNVLNIPGRNGDLLGFGSKLENVEITYRAFIYTNFDANIAALRSFLLSHVGYFKLTDSYHPDEYRLAYYKGPFVPDVVANNGAGSFDLTFVCKPQRFLNSGEEVTTLTPAGAEQHTYQGEIVNFSTLAGDKITSARADFHPIQDLHGYANPWPGGGGANQWDEEWERGTIGMSTGAKVDDNTKIRSKNYVPISPNTAYYYKFPGNWRMVYFDSDKNVVEQGNTYSPNIILTSPATAHYLLFALDGATEYDNNIAINYPSTVTTYSPYSNICPISGRTGVNVYRTGKNLLDKANVLQDLFIKPATMKIGAIGDTGASVYCPIKGGETYTVSKIASARFTIATTTDLPANNVSINDYISNNSATSLTIQTTENDKYIVAFVYLASADTGKTQQEIVDSVQVEQGSTATTYEPYTGNTYSVDWTTEAGTVYGGTLDVVTGVLTIDRAMVDLGTLNWGYSASAAQFRASLNYAKDTTSTEVPNMKCEIYKTVSFAGMANNDMCISRFFASIDGINVKDSRYTDAATFKTAMSGVQLVYELATPLTYQLTAQEIEALADNYMWSDVGQVTVTVTDAMTIENPTLFDAKPLLRVYGAGTLTLGGQTITISTADVYTDIDCELMDCFKDTVSKNGNVSFSGYDFPVIPPGRNVITMDGVTQVDITPRWWAA